MGNFIIVHPNYTFEHSLMSFFLFFSKKPCSCSTIICFICYNSIIIILIISIWHYIFLLKYLAIATEYLSSILIILAIVLHLIKEEQRQRFDAVLEVAFLFAEVRLNGLANLDACLVLLRHVTHRLVDVQLRAIREDDLVLSRQNLRDTAILVLVHFSGLIEDVAPLFEGLGDTLDASAFQLLLKFNSSHRLFILRDDDVFEVKVTVGALDVLQLEANHFNLLNQFLSEGIQSIQHIHRVVHILMRSRVVERKQRIELLQRLLCGSTTHLLWFVENDDGVIGLYHINRTA